MSELYDILTETPPTKVVLLALDQGLWDCERSLAELSALCEANHMEAVAQITQKRQTPETGIVLGSGKLEEAWGTGTAAVISPIGEMGWEDRHVVVNGGKIGPLAQRLYDTLTGIQWGKLPDTKGWIVPVCKG